MMHTATTRLSKSKIAAFEHCAKRLWLQVHRRGEARFDEATLARFQFGHDVGKRARLLVPNGILIETGMDMTAALERTAELIAKGFEGPIFEATFEYHNVLVRVDILRPVAGGGWEAIEVKASTGVHSYHLADLATQVWVMRGGGLDVTKATIRHLGRRVSWWRPDYGAVTFRDVEVTSDIEQFVSERPLRAAAAAEMLRGGEPERAMGSYCHRPLACEFRDHCFRSAQAQLENRVLM